MSGQHRLEQRAQLLAARLTTLRDDLRANLAAPGERPPFTEAMTPSAALDWWTQHRHDQYGQAVLGRMQPVAVAELDAALYQHVNAPPMEVDDAG